MRWKYSRLLILVIFCSFILYITPVRGTVLVTEELIAEADSDVDSTSITANTGGKSYIEVSNSENSFQGIHIGYLRFDLSTIFGSVISATLELYTSYVSETHNIGIHACSDNSWDELTINYENRPFYDPVALNTTLVASDSTWYSWTVTDSIQNALNDGKISFSVVSEDLHDTAWIRFESRDQQYSWKEEYRPVLKIVYSETETAETSINSETSDITSPSTFEISGELEDLEFIEYDFSLTTKDLLEIYLKISTSSVDIEISANDQRSASWHDVSDRFQKKIATTVSGPHTLRIENPGVVGGGDKLSVEGYYIIKLGEANQAQVLISSENVSWSITSVVIIGLVCVNIIKRRKQK